jgi:uncharacterized glyoxalase superfamily protein PhnB
MKLKKLSPVLIADAIEPVLSFWTERLGFTKTVEVPHEGHLGFVILTRDNIEVMYQTAASTAADVPAIGKVPLRGSLLFIEVDDLDAIEKALKGVPLVTPRRKTFYGSEEIIVREPAGNVVNFAQFANAT